MGQTRVYPVRVNGGSATVLLSADEIIEAAEEGRLMIAPEDRLHEAADASEGGAASGSAAQACNPAGSSLLDRIREITSRVPPEAWESLPEDLSENHDHYIYGTPKR